MRNYGEHLPNNCLNWLALGACIYGDERIDEMLRLVGLQGVKEKVRTVSDEEIVSMYQGGLSVSKIERRTGVNRWSLKQILVKAGVYKFKTGALVRKNAYKEVDVAEIVRLRLDGASLRKIAEKIGVSRVTIKNRLEKVGLE